MNRMSAAAYRATVNTKKKKENKEHIEQSNFFKGINSYLNEYPELESIFAVPNANILLSTIPQWQRIRVISFMKSEGFRPGIPDIFFPVPRNEYHGLFIEMKFGKNKLSDYQKDWFERLQKNGYKCIACYSANEALDNILNYLNGKTSERNK